MTRDEAIEKVEACFLFNRPGQEWVFNPRYLMDAFVELGMLKLDEPKTLDARINTAINEELLCGKREKCAGSVKKALDAAGLKIVEK